MLARSFYRYNRAQTWPQSVQSRRFAGALATPGMRTAPRFPALNVWTSEDGAIASVRLPGVNTDDLDISIKDDRVTIAGSHSPENGQNEPNYLRRELRYGNFSRTFQLPFSVGADKVEATYENGILKIYLPQAEADKPRKIAVKSA